jgi:hypothetical protein
MISAYASIIGYQHDDWEEYFDRIAMIEIFKPVIEFYKEDKVKLKCVIQFIIHAYSVESEKVILGMDWQKNKQQIFEDTCIPRKELYDHLVLLKSESVLETVNRWIDFQNNLIFCELMMIKDLRMSLMLSVNGSIKKSSGEEDYTQRYLNSTYVTELRVKIKDLESEFIQNNNKLKDAVKEFKAAKKNKNTMSAVQAFTNE